MAVLFVAIRFGLWPSVYTSLLSFFAYNFFFTEPHHTFLVERRGRRADRRLLPGGRGHRRQPRGAAQGPGRGDAPDHPAHRQSLRLQPQDRRRRCARTTCCGRRCITSRRRLQCHSLVLLPREGDRLEIASGYPPEDQMSPTAWGAARLGLGARPGGRLGLGHAAGLGMAVPAAQDRARAGRPARRLVREPEARS